MSKWLPNAKIKLDDRFAPSWIGRFTFAITIAWACYVVYIRLVSPFFSDAPHMKEMRQGIWESHSKLHKTDLPLRREP